MDTPIAPPLTGDDGGQTPSSEYFLHFKVVLGAPEIGGGRPSTLGLGFGRSWLSLVTVGVTAVYTKGNASKTQGSRVSPTLFISSLKFDSTLTPTHF